MAKGLGTAAQLSADTVSRLILAAAKSGGFVIQPVRICTWRIVDIALNIDRYDFAIRVDFEDGRPVARIQTPAVTMPKLRPSAHLLGGRVTSRPRLWLILLADCQTQAR